MSVIVDLAIFPVDKGVSVSSYVARAVRIIKNSGLPHVFGPMGTSIEGEWSEVMDVVNQCMKDFTKDCDRIYMTIKVDYRRGGDNRIEKKVASVEGKLI